MNNDRNTILSSLVFPFLFTMLLWLVKIFEVISKTDLAFLGIRPLHLNGLQGVLFAPLLHGDFQHLIANSLPIFILSWALYYFYRVIAYKIFFLSYVMHGIWVWVFARENIHIGASGLVYSLATFLFLSGILRREKRVLAISMLVVFLYGSLIWGVFPEFFPQKNISWESHFMGMLAGFILAIYYRKEGPQREVYEWEAEEEEEIEQLDD